MNAMQARVERGEEGFGESAGRVLAGEGRAGPSLPAARLEREKRPRRAGEFGGILCDAMGERGLPLEPAPARAQTRGVEFSLRRQGGAAFERMRPEHRARESIPFEQGQSVLSRQIAQQAGRRTVGGHRLQNEAGETRAKGLARVVAMQKGKTEAGVPRLPGIGEPAASGPLPPQRDQSDELRAALDDPHLGRAVARHMAEERQGKGRVEEDIVLEAFGAKPCPIVGACREACDRDARDPKGRARRRVEGVRTWTARGQGAVHGCIMGRSS